MSLVTLLWAGRVAVGFDTTEEGWLYTELAGRLLQLAYWPAIFVLVFMFVFAFVPQLYQFPAKLAMGVRILIFFKL